MNLIVQRAAASGWSAEAIRAAPRLTDPWTLFFFIAALVFLALSLVPIFLHSRDVRWQRRMYWGCTTGVALCAFLAAIPDFAGGAVFAAAAFVYAIIPAYFSGRLIKVGGRIIAFHIQDGTPDPVPGKENDAPSTADNDDETPSYGGTVSAPKLWWLMVVGMGICSFNIGLHLTGTETERPWLWPLFVVVVLVTGLGIGVGDGASGVSVARRQYVQFAVIAITTGGAFVVFYLVGYVIGRRRLSRQVAGPGRTIRHQKR
jgi:hypothetical protein